MTRYTIAVESQQETLRAYTRVFAFLFLSLHILSMGGWKLWCQGIQECLSIQWAMCLRNWLVPLLCVGFLLCYNFKIIEKLQEIAPGAHKYPLSRFTGCLYFVLFGLSFFLYLSSYVPHIHISLSSIFREGNNFMYLVIRILILPPPPKKNYLKASWRHCTSSCLHISMLENNYILYNHLTAIRFRKINIDIKLLSTILSIFQFLIVSKVSFPIFSPHHKQPRQKSSIALNCLVSIVSLNYIIVFQFFFFISWLWYSLRISSLTLLIAKFLLHISTIDFGSLICINLSDFLLHSFLHPVTRFSALLIEREFLFVCFLCLFFLSVYCRLQNGPCVFLNLIVLLSSFNWSMVQRYLFP